MASWRHLGFDFNPFSTQPLEHVETGPTSHRLFVGRGDEVRRLAARIRDSPDGSASIVEGHLGSGKTSLLTMAKARLAQPTDGQGGFLIPIDHVRIQTTTSFDDFAYAVVDHILGTVKAPGFPHAVDKGGTIAEALRLLAGGKDRSGGFTVGALGAQVGLQAGGKSRSPFIQPKLDWHQLLRGIAAEIVSLDYEGVIVHVNNLENLVERDPDAVRTLLRDAADLFQTQGCHFILVAPVGFTVNLLGSVEPVRTVFPTAPLQIDLLAEAEFARAVQVRYQHAAPSGKYVPPVSLDVAQELYRLTGGSLRATFRVIGDWVERADPARVRTANRIDELVELLQPQYGAVLDALPNREKDALNAAVRLGDPFRQKGIVRLSGLEQSYVSGLMEKLESKGFIVLEREEGTSKWYRVDERVLIATWQASRGPGGPEAEAAAARPR